MTLRVVLDTETTGLAHNDPGGPRPDGILAVGVAWSVDGGVTVESRTFEANPCLPGGFDYLKDGRAAGALRVNGFTEARVRALPLATQVADEVAAFFHDLAARHGKLSLTTYNVEFDRPLLDAGPWRLSTDTGTFAAWEECVMLRAVRVFDIKSRSGHVRLKDALARANLDYDGSAHDAAVDARAALRLSFYLDGVERERLMAKGMTDEDEARAVLDALAVAEVPPMPTPQRHDVGKLAPTMLAICVKKLWRQQRDGHDAGLREWQEERGQVGYAAEDIVFDKLSSASIRFVRGEYVENADLRGKLDGRIEWPRGSGRWHIVEVKSTVTKLEKVLREPMETYLLQWECYARLSGYGRIMVIAYGLGYGEQGRLGGDFYRQDDRVWARVQGRIALIRAALASPAAPICECGRCPP